MTTRSETVAGLVVDAMLDAAHPVKMQVAEWARTHLDVGDVVSRDHESVFARDAWVACAEEGIIGSAVPVEAGGRGDDLVTTALKLEGLGLGCVDNGLAFAIVSQLVSFQEVLSRFGSPEQHRDVLTPACRGSLLGAFAITEEGAGSDTASMTTRATATADGWILDGEKAHITLAPVADVAIVFAVTDPDAGRWGVSAFLVDLRRPGVSVSENRPKMGFRTTPYGSIRLHGYEASSSDLVGSVGGGSSIFASCVEVERGLAMAVHLGAAERVIETAVARANTRVQFGRPIGGFQAVSHRLADMALRHESARLLLYKAVGRLALGSRATLSSAMAKLGASEAIAAIALDAARIHGAEGYDTEYEVEREVRDALGTLVYGGTSDIQRNLIASLMGVTGGAP